MGNLRIGSSDRGWRDREDNLYVAKTALKKGLTADEATRYASQNSGAEAIVREKDGTYSVYRMSTSESGKEILNSDFEDGSIDLDTQVANQLHGDKAYVSTNTNYLRTLEYASIELDNLEQNFATAALRLTLEDLDGLDQASKLDLKGTLNGQVLIDRSALEYGLAEAENATHLDLKLSSYSKDQYLQVDVAYGVLGLGNIKISPAGIGLKVEVGGLAGALADTVDWAGKAVGLDPEEAVDEIVQKMAKQMGMKVVSSGLTEYRLEPDLENNPMFKSFALGQGQAIQVESIQVDRQATGFKIRNGGDLELNIGNAQVRASTDSKGKQAIKDKEGSDKLELELKASLRNDQQVTAEAQTELAIQVKPEEAAGLQTQLKKLGVDAPKVSGNISVTDISAQSQFKIGEAVQITQTQTGQFAFQDFQLSVDKTQVQFDVDGKVEAAQKGSQIQLQAQDVRLSGQVDSPEGKLTVNSLSFGGELSLDQKQPQKLSFALDAQQPLKLDGELQVKALQKKGRFKALEVSNAKAEIDLAQGQLAVQGQKGKPAQVKAEGLGLGTQFYLGQLQLQGNLDANLKTGALDLNAQNVSFWAQFDQAKLDYFKGSGKIHYAPGEGFQANQAEVDMRGTINEMNLKRLKGKGDIAVSESGQLSVKNGRGIDFQSSFPGDINLDLKGNFDLQMNGPILEAQTQGKAATLNLSGGEVVLENLQIKGKTRFDTSQNKLSVESLPNQPLELPSGQIGELAVKNVVMQNARMDAELNREIFTFSPVNGPKISLSGEVNGVKIASLEAEGAIQVKARQNHVAFQDPVHVKMPDYGLHEISSDGPLEFWVDRQGLLHINAQGTTINGKFENMSFQDVKLNGEIIFDPRQQRLSVAASSENGLTFQGKINEFPLDLSSKGEVTFHSNANGLEIEGKNVQVKGLLDGFVLESGADTQGKIQISHDGRDVKINELDFDVKFEDIALQNNQTVLQRTPDGGYEINLSGQLMLKQNELFKLLDKLDQHQGLSEQVRKSLQDIDTQLKAHLKSFDEINAQYQNLRIKFDDAFRFQGIEGTQAASVSNMQVAISQRKGAPTLNLGKVDVTTDLNITPTATTIPAGSLSFGFTPDLRTQLAKSIAVEMEAAGFEDVKLTISPTGDVDIQNATYVHKSEGKGLFGGKKEKVRHISARLALDVELKGNQVQVRLEEFALKNLIYNLLSKVAMSKGEIEQMAADELKKQDLQLQYDRQTHLFTLDLNQNLKTLFSEDMELKSAELKEGQILIQYAVGPQKP